MLDTRVEKIVQTMIRKNTRAGYQIFTKEDCCYFCCCVTTGGNQREYKKSNARIKAKEGLVYFYTTESRLILDIPMVNGRLTPVVIGAGLTSKPAKNGHELVLIEEDESGKQLGGFALSIETK